jgi:ADP-heptose:LPS heptosyltransferase
VKTSTMTAIDRRLGKPVCAVLTGVRRLGRFFAGSRVQRNAPLRKILFIKMAEQGATVLAYRALCRATELVGRDNVYFWVFEENREILDLMGVIPQENVITVRSKTLRTFAVDIARSLWRIRRLGIDATVDMEFLARAPAILAFLTGATRRSGLHRFTVEGPYRGDLLTHRVQHNPYLHTALAYHELVEALDQPPGEVPLLKRALPTVDGAPPRFVPESDECQRVQALLDRLAGRPVDSPIILLNPNASDMLPLRKWPTERFVELGRRILAHRPDATLVITGAPSERVVAGEVGRAIGSPRVISVAGETTLRELMVLYSIADILVTNDSGPGHFASMTGIDTVVLFGPETPALYGPLGKNSHVLWAGLTCSPCINPFNHRISPCNDNVCMQWISVSQVFVKLQQLLAQRPRLRLVNSEQQARRAT